MLMQRAAVPDQDGSLRLVRWWEWEWIQINSFGFRNL